MRVLQLIDSLNIGGAERLAVTYANALQEVIGASFLCTTRQEGALKSQIHKEVGYLHAARTKVLDKKAVTTVTKYIKEHKIDIIHAHGTSFLFAFLIKKKVPLVKVVWHIHSGNLPNASRSKKLMIRYCMSSMDGVVCVNNELKEWVQSKYRNQKVVYLRNFVRFRESNTKNEILELAGDTETRVICLANLRKPKDHHTLVNAFTVVLSSIPDAQLLLLGQDFKDSYSASLKTIIQESGITKSVHILGLQSNPDCFLNQSKVGVLSSTSEGLPMSLLEYGRAGLIPVVTDVGQCATVVGETGYVVPANDVNDLGKAIISALNGPKITDFKEKVKREYSQTTVISNLLDVYTSLLKEK